jgi:hypothetical protein
MAVKRKSEVFYKYQLSKSHHDKVRPLMDYYLLQYVSGKMSLTEASKNAEYVIRYSYIFKNVNTVDLMSWEIESSETTPHP